MNFKAILLTFFSFAFCSQFRSFNDLPDDVLELVFSAGQFKDIKALVLVSKKFRLVVPRLFYRFYEQTCLDTTCRCLPSSEPIFDDSSTPWTIIGIDEDGTIKTDQKIMNTAFILLNAGDLDHISSKIRSRLFKYIETDSQRTLFRDSLDAMLGNVLPSVAWDFPSMAIQHIDFYFRLYPSYHIPLLELGWHPRKEEIIKKMLCIVVHYEGGIGESQHQLENYDYEGNQLFKMAKQILQTSFVNRATLIEHCLTIADSVYFFLGPEKIESLSNIFHRFLGSDDQFMYDELTFQTRITEDPDRIYRLIVTLELLVIIPNDLITDLQHPLVFTRFEPFFAILKDIIAGVPISIEGYTPLMIESLRCFLRFPIHHQHKTSISHAIWKADDTILIDLLLSCCSECSDSDFYERALTKKGKMVLPLAFGIAHWPLIYGLTLYSPERQDFLVEWISEDLHNLVITRDPASIAAYRDLFKKSFAFNKIFHTACYFLAVTNRFTEDEIWTLRSLFPDKASQFIIDSEDI